MGGELHHTAAAPNEFGDRLPWLGLDVLACPRCSGRMKVIATIEQASPRRDCRRRGVKEFSEVR